MEVHKVGQPFREERRVGDFAPKENLRILDAKSCNHIQNPAISYIRLCCRCSSSKYFSFFQKIGHTRFIMVKYNIRLEEKTKLSECE